MKGFPQFFLILGAVIFGTIGLRFVDRLFPRLVNPPAGLKALF